MTASTAQLRDAFGLVFLRCKLLKESGPDSTLFLPGYLRFFEYRSTGPGAKINDKRRQLSDAQAAAYKAANVLNGRRP